MNKQRGDVVPVKICILSVVNIRHMSLVSLYTSFFKERGIDYDIIYIDKYGIVEPTGAMRVYRYSIRVDRSWNRVRKLVKYVGFRKYVGELLSSNKYDYLILWKTETAILLYDIIKAHKARGKKYCMNIRDYSMEHNPVVFLLVASLVANSDFTTISSNGFRVFLPRHEYELVHSLNEEITKACVPKKGFRLKDEPIRVCFIGYVRFFEQDKMLIDALGNDPRYLIQYYGEGSHVLEEYAREHSISNVRFVSGFDVSATSELLETADVINNLYGNNNIALDTAVSIKYYYALHLRVPILVMKDTYMEQVSTAAGIGFVVDSMDSLADDFYDWYHSLNFSSLSSACAREIASISEEKRHFAEKLAQTFAPQGGDLT